MLNVIGGQKGQREGHADAVVAAQGGLLGGDHVALNHDLNGVFQKIVGGVRRFFTDHVHVGLENHARAVLMARGAGLAD